MIWVQVPNIPLNLKEKYTALMKMTNDTIHVKFKK